MDHVVPASTGRPEVNCQVCQGHSFGSRGAERILEQVEVPELLDLLARNSVSPQQRGCPIEYMAVCGGTVRHDVAFKRKAFQVVGEVEVYLLRSGGEIIEQPATRYRGRLHGKAFTVAPDAGFGYNPGTGWARWDKRGAMPDQVGGTGKNVAIIEPDQKTYLDYKLPDADLYPGDERALAPALLDSAGAATETVILGGSARRTIKTPLEPVIVQRSQLPHLDEKDPRRRFANFIIPTLEDPNEIWLSAYDDGFRRRFIKLFKGPTADMLVIARENRDGSLFWNAFRANSKYIDRQRTGVLLYRR